MKTFEKSIIQELLDSKGYSGNFLVSALDETVCFSGVGYFLTLSSQSLPGERMVMDNPLITGSLGGVTVGFIAFIENHELTLECYSYGEEITEEHRNEGFVRTST